MWERGREQGKIQGNKPRSRAPKRASWWYFSGLPDRRLPLPSLGIDWILRAQFSQH